MYCTCRAYSILPFTHVVPNTLHSVSLWCQKRWHTLYFSLSTHEKREFCYKYEHSLTPSGIPKALRVSTLQYTPTLMYVAPDSLWMKILPIHKSITHFYRGVYTTSYIHHGALTTYMQVKPLEVYLLSISQSHASLPPPSIIKFVSARPGSDLGQ